jgi:hypothetical protein
MRCRERILSGEDSERSRARGRTGRVKPRSRSPSCNGESLRVELSLYTGLVSLVKKREENSIFYQTKDDIFFQIFWLTNPTQEKYLHRHHGHLLIMKLPLAIRSSLSLAETGHF